MALRLPRRDSKHNQSGYPATHRAVAMCRFPVSGSAPGRWPSKEHADLERSCIRYLCAAELWPLVTVQNDVDTSVSGPASGVSFEATALASPKPFAFSRMG
jgi:hypothetical protein